MKKKILLLFAVIIIITGCSKATQDISDNSTSVSNAEQSKEEIEKQEAFQNSSAQNDTDVGLKNIKIDTSEINLTDEQKAVLKYFDQDYLDVPEYEFIRRYPNLFQDAQISVWGKVQKVISMDAENYEMIIWLGMMPSYDAWLGEEYAESHKNEYVILRGKTESEAWFMEEDPVYALGRYTGVESITIDGTSYNIPSVEAYNTYLAIDNRAFIVPANRNTNKEIKMVAQAIFGKDIEVRTPTPGIDYTEETEMLYDYTNGEFPFLLVELENQSNANFTKFLFETDYPSIIDNKEPMDAGSETSIERYIEFSADFEHFYLFTTDSDMQTSKVAYYTRDLQKEWEREFEETTNMVYDYTKNNIYMVVNNTLYIINVETGEDTFEPVYVGEKKEVRKVSDGLIMIAKNQSDGVMKSNLDGSIAWNANLVTDVLNVNGVQLVNNNVIIQYEDENYNDHYMLVDNTTGEVVINAESVSQ